MTLTKGKEAQRTETRSETRTEPPWNVILYNDRNQINRVVWRLYRTIAGMTLHKAMLVTWEAHTSGRAVATTCHKELAEFYEKHLREKGLTVSIEPD